MFSSKAATLLQEKHIKVDWGKRDRDLMTLIGAGVEINICKLCHMIDHDTNFCPLQLSGKNEDAYSNRTSQPLRNNSITTDKRGRNRVFHNGKEICNNFNTADGCIRQGRCAFLHICILCRAFDHSKTACSRLNSHDTNGKKGKTPAVNSSVTVSKQTSRTEKV